MRLPERLAGDRSGAAALEFALMLPVFLAFVFSTFETGWIMVRATALDRALDISVRKVRIGADDAPTSQAEMKAAICSEMAVVVPGCLKAMVVEMSVVKTAAGIPSNKATCVDRGSTYEPAVTFTTGDRAEIMYVRACLVSNPITPLVGVAMHMSKDSRGGYSLVSRSAFVNEPADR